MLYLNLRTYLKFIRLISNGLEQCNAQAKSRIIHNRNKLAMVNNLKINTLYLECQLIYWNHQGYVERRTYRSQKRAWIGFKIAKKDGDHDKLRYYAEGIQKFERQLRLPVSNFTDILKEETENDLDTTKQKEEGGAATNELSPS